MIRTTLTSILGAFALLSTACAADDSSDDGADSADTSTDPATTDPATTDPATTDPGESTGAAACADLCATYGPAVPTVASQIVDQAATDPLFMADFAPLVAEGDAAVMAFKTSLANFISDAYGCTSGAYTGPTMEAAHAGLGITQAEYDAFLGIIVGVLMSNNVPEDDINMCFAPPLTDAAFVATIVGL